MDGVLAMVRKLLSCPGVFMPGLGRPFGAAGVCVDGSGSSGVFSVLNGPPLASDFEVGVLIDPRILRMVLRVFRARFLFSMRRRERYANWMNVAARESRSTTILDFVWFTSRCL